MEQTIKTEEVGTKSFGFRFFVTVFAVLKIFFIQRKKLKKTKGTTHRETSLRVCGVSPKKKRVYSEKDL